MELSRQVVVARSRPESKAGALSVRVGQRGHDDDSTSSLTGLGFRVTGLLYLLLEVLAIVIIMGRK